jgi:hypothetical protein
VSNKPQITKDRICSAKQMAESVIEERVRELKNSSEGCSLPIDSIRLDLMRHRHCVCSVALELLEKKINGQ